MKDICIIGGGASGLAAAITAAKKGKKVTIIERNEKCGKKILITGSGKCNYFNDNQNINKYHSTNRELIKEIITEENINKVKTFFNKLGIIPKIIDGYYYPFSRTSVTIQNALIEEAKKLNVEIIYNIKVEKIIKKDFFIINPEKEKIKAKKIVLCSGSKAAPKTGSDGSGYDLAMSFNHKIIKPHPALISLKGDKNYYKKWSGVRTEAILKLYEDNNFIKEEKGEIQLTDQGISGIVTFNLSNLITQKLKTHEEIIYINFIPFLKENNLDSLFKTNKKISEVLERILNYKLVNVLIKEAKLKTNYYDKLDKKEKNKLLNTLTNFKIKITETGSFDKAQVCTGGVSLEEINLKTMESKKEKNLYLAGEILDINGDCGGYNLTFAWLSGILVGENI
ncbi:MAG: aminoacetone oxidase family FAD-binding enzyme [Bacilli bacterium]|nr:aminoacetone oxidase family FAD-binding enzyme [Bacilli bacterium]